MKIRPHSISRLRTYDRGRGVGFTGGHYHRNGNQRLPKNRPQRRRVGRRRGRPQKRRHLTALTEEDLNANLEDYKKAEAVKKKQREKKRESQKD